MGAAVSISPMEDEDTVRTLRRTDTALGKIEVMLENAKHQRENLAPRPTEDEESSEEEPIDEEDKQAAAAAKAVMGEKPKKAPRPEPPTQEELHAQVLDAIQLLQELRDDVTKMHSGEHDASGLGDRLTGTLIEHGLHQQHGLDYIPVFRQHTGRRVVMPWQLGRDIRGQVTEGDLDLALSGPQRMLLLSNVDMQLQTSVDVVCARLKREDVELTRVRLFKCNLQDEVSIAVAAALSRGGSSKSVTALDVTDNELIGGPGFAALFKACPHLTSVNLTMCQKLKNEDLTQLCQHCPGVAILSLRKCFKITDPGIKVVVEMFGANMRSLDLGLCSALSDHSLELVAKHCPNLELLDLHGCKALTSKSIKTVAERCLKLQTLDLSLCQRLAEFGLGAIGTHLRFITILDLSGCWLLKDPGLSALHACTRLACLNLAKVCLISDDCLVKFGSTLSLLERIELEGCTQVSDVGLEALAKGCPNLVTVGLQNCVKVTDTGVYNLTDNCRHITTLRLDKCKQVTDVGVRWAGERVPGLQHLSLNFCKSVTDAAAEGLVPRCGNLNHLSVSGCAYLSDRFLQEISSGYKRLLFLEYVNLSKCEAITDAGIAALTKGCGHKLRDLNIGDCKSLTNKAIFSIATVCGVLRLLRCNNIPQLTNNAVNAIAKGCRFLRLLNIEGCSQITDVLGLATCSELRLIFIGGTEVNDVESLKSVLPDTAIPRWPEAKHPTSVDAIMR